MPPRKPSSGSCTSKATCPRSQTRASGWRAWLGFSVDRAKKRREQPLDDTVIEQLLATGAGAEQVAMERQMRALLGQMVAGLPRELRDVVRLSTVEELSSADVAILLEIPEASVRSRLFRARQLLREKMLAATEKKS